MSLLECSSIRGVSFVVFSIYLLVLPLKLEPHSQKNTLRILHILVAFSYQELQINVMFTTPTDGFYDYCDSSDYGDLNVSSAPL